MDKSKFILKPLAWSMTLLMTALVAGCGGSGGGAGAGGGGSGAASPASTGPVGSVCTGAGCVNLGTAGNYAILAQTGVSTIPNSVVTGNIGLSPKARIGLTGWAETTEPTDTAWTSAQVVAPGKLYAADMVGGTTTVDLTTAVGDMQTAYTSANGLAPAGGGLGTPCPTDGTTIGALGGVTITPGVYTCTVPLSIAAGLNVTLTGTATDVWVIRTTQGITQATGTQVILAGGALAKNVFWVPALTVGIGGTAGAATIMQGVILAKTNITIGTNATVNGRLLAQTAVTLDQSTITKP